MKEIIIGEGHSGYSAYLVRLVPGCASISQNNGWFWIHHNYYDIDIRLEKLHPEGMILQRLLVKQSSDKVVGNFLDKLLFARLSPKEIRGMFTEAYNKGIERGQEMQAALMRQALMV